jgi:E3 ubiquitin-protein ligase CHFR
VASLVDLSTNGTFIGDSKLGKNNEVLLKNGDEIYLLHKSKVSITDVIGFTLII